MTVLLRVLWCSRFQMYLEIMSRIRHVMQGRVYLELTGMCFGDQRQQPYLFIYNKSFLSVGTLIRR